MVRPFPEASFAVRAFPWDDADERPDPVALVKTWWNDDAVALPPADAPAWVSPPDGVPASPVRPPPMVLDDAFRTAPAVDGIPDSAGGIPDEEGAAGAGATEEAAGTRVLMAMPPTMQKPCQI